MKPCNHACFSYFPDKQQELKMGNFVSINYEIKLFFILYKN